MVRIHSQLQQRHLRTQMILQVHDELVFDLYRPEQEEVRALVLDQMQNALPLDGLKVEVGIDVGPDWLSAH
jgi:DNA polymerase-1